MSAAAAGWVEHWAGLAAPAREAVSLAAGIAEGVSVLDVGCGSGEFCGAVRVTCADVGWS